MDKKIKLQTYCWIGIDRNGKRQQGEQAAQHVIFLKNALKKQGITPIKIRKKSMALFRLTKISKQDIRIFSRQLATMTYAGISVVQALTLVEKNQTKPSMKQLTHQLKTAIEGGASIAEALKQHAAQFNNLYCNLVMIGEQSGKIDLMFDRIATYQEKTFLLKNKIKKALFYPAAVIVVAILITVGLLIFVVPQFEMLFNGFGAQLPYTTQLIIQFSIFLQHYGWLLFVLLTVSIGGCVMAQKRSIKFAIQLDKILLHLPVVGAVIKKSIIARFARALATTFAAGLPLIDALQTVAKVTGNHIYNTAALDIKAAVTTGQPLNGALQNTKLFPGIVIQMIAIGEVSGTLEVMLEKVAHIFEEEVDQVINHLTNLLEPFIMIILGVLIGGLVIAMYLPIFRLGSVL